MSTIADYSVVIQFNFEVDCNFFSVNFFSKMMSALGNINSHFLIQTGCRGRRPIIRKKLYRIKKFSTLPLGLQMILICSFLYLYLCFKYYRVFRWLV